jgi:hypothetical protein
MFSLSLFASGVFARVNCDKEHCKHHNLKGLQYTKVDVDIMSMGCCAGTQSDPCDLEKGQTPEINDITLSLTRAGNGDPSDVIGIKSNPIPEYLSFRTYGVSLEILDTARSAPLYIQNASLII